MSIPKLASSLAAIALVSGCTSGPIASRPAFIAPGRTDTAFTQVSRGMPEAEVQRLLGPPDETMRFPLSQSEAWDYRYYDTWGYIAIFSVTFGPDGRVASTISNRINSGGDHASNH